MPLCLECVGRVREEVEATLKEVEAECEAYQAGLDRLLQEPCRSMPQEVSAGQHDQSGWPRSVEGMCGLLCSPLAVCGGHQPTRFPTADDFKVLRETTYCNGRLAHLKAFVQHSHFISKAVLHDRSLENPGQRRVKAQVGS